MSGGTGTALKSKYKQIKTVTKHAHKPTQSKDIYPRQYITKIYQIKLEGHYPTHLQDRDKKTTYAILLVPNKRQPIFLDKTTTTNTEITSLQTSAA